VKKHLNNNDQRSLFKWVAFVIIIGVCVLLINLNPMQANAKQATRTASEAQKTVSSAAPAQAEQGAKLTAWKIIEWCDWTFWPFVLITAGGIMLITYRALSEYRDKSRSQTLMQGKIKLNDVKRILRMSQGKNPTRAWRLFHHILVTFEKTHRAEPIGNEINKFLVSERDSFESFNRIINYLSDTSGALGLLGTVWGIFLTFHSGKMDGPTILQGMSIALVTTLVGLIISIALNFCLTYLFTMFNGQLNQLSERAEAIRQVLLIHENKGFTAQSSQMEESDMEIQTVEMNYKTQKKPRVDRSMDMAYETNY